MLLIPRLELDSFSLKVFTLVTLSVGLQTPLLEFPALVNTGCFQVMPFIYYTSVETDWFPWVLIWDAAYCSKFVSLLYTLLVYQPCLISLISLTSVEDRFLTPQYSYTPSHLIILSVLFCVVWNSLLSVMALSSFQRSGRSPHSSGFSHVLCFYTNEFSLNNIIKQMVWFLLF